MSPTAAGRGGRLLERLRIDHLAGRPAQLSGGERQRVGLARALARNPSILTLDEPVSALDAHTRAGVRVELQELLGDLRLPTLLVTHDFEDAAALADRVGVIVDGRVLQVGSPGELVEAPANPFVASFTGNLMPELPGPLTAASPRSRSTPGAPCYRLMRAPGEWASSSIPGRSRSHETPLRTTPC